MDVKDTTKSQKINLKWWSIWSAKCKEFQGKIKVWDGNGRDGQCESQKMEWKWWSIWSVRCKGFLRKMKVWGGSGRDGQHEIEENELKVVVSMECKMQEIRMGNKGLRWQRTWRTARNRIKMNLKWWSVWSAKCKELLKKIRACGGNGRDGQREIAEN